MGVQLNFEDWLALTQLYADYASAVDSGNWDLWPEFFTEQCVYRLQPRENHERGLPLATLSFTSKGMLKDRVYGIKETLFHDPYYQRHVVGTPVVRPAPGPRLPSVPPGPPSHTRTAPSAVCPPDRNGAPAGEAKRRSGDLLLASAARGGQGTVAQAAMIRQLLRLTQAVYEAAAAGPSGT